MSTQGDSTSPVEQIPCRHFPNSHLDVVVSRTQFEQTMSSLHGSSALLHTPA
jgi:hypothetical protein